MSNEDNGYEVQPIVMNDQYNFDIENQRLATEERRAKLAQTSV